MRLVTLRSSFLAKAPPLQDVRLQIVHLVEYLVAGSRRWGFPGSPPLLGRALAAQHHRTRVSSLFREGGRPASRQLVKGSETDVTELSTRTNRTGHPAPFLSSLHEH